MNTLGFIGIGNLAEYTIKGLRIPAKLNTYSGGR
jgi:pyrroline-5-carboxylate reductase